MFALPTFCFDASAFYIGAVDMVYHICNMYTYIYIYCTVQYCCGAVPLRTGFYILYLVMHYDE